MSPDVHIRTCATLALQGLLARGLTLATAESITGGGFHYYCTSVPGASTAMRGGANVYTPEAKIILGNVDAVVIDLHGTVAPETSLALAHGIRRILKSDIGMGVTGNAGPTAETPAHPVGRVYWALVTQDAVLQSTETFAGDRQAVLEQAILAGFTLLAEHLEIALPAMATHE